ncbi:MAG: U32 family peptidase [Burkholderiales bacterium]|nr:U32 family peptidase [Burkholderiales bacterium]
MQNLPDPAAPAAARLRLTVGPVLYHWPRETLLAFYEAVAETAADTVVIGESICARRREMRLADWLAVGRELKAAGKEVVLVSQALIESEADLRLIERQAEQQEFAVEAGDASALQILAGRVPLVLGPHLNIYSREALHEHADLGATRWVAAVELALDAMALINPPAAPVRTPEGRPITTEAWGFGRLALAFSARCFTARHHGSSRDDCEQRCGADPDGLALETGEKQPFLVLNGTQTQSAAVHNLIGEAAALRAAGVASLRLSPCAQGFTQVVADFEAALNAGGLSADPRETWQSLGVPGPFSNGYAHRLPGMNWSPT